MDVSEAVPAKHFRITTTGVAALCLMYVAAAIMVAPRTYFAMLTEYTLRKYSLPVPLFALFGMAGVAIVSRPSSPLTFTLEKLRHRGKGALIVVGIFVLCAAAFSTIKHVTPIYVPFFADPFLAWLDAAIHAGDAWRLAHAIFPPQLEPGLFVLYGPVWFIQMVGMVLIAAFTNDGACRARYFFSFLLVAVLVGSLVRIIGSSAGPIFFERIVGSDRFNGLMSALAATSSGRAMIATSDYLYSSYALDRTVFGTGIAAMPSMHVAVALLNALFLSQFGRAIRYWGWFYFGAIMFGSVYFGWHYAIDGYFSIIATIAIWRYSGRRIGGATPARWAP
ncbi:phosphatase PAP2 family protein [Mesorhizobium sp. VK23B]|uniref:Phosphatase PAP2 family protein n=1 Tax=Mesorhizobium dulcispinae TaxID=3072316 RepID=A0ABU4XLQ1_9HYPH|nr:MULTISPECIES: phosphatase PAP2 family protein [unclassified Mesorhizobium]MDX8469323.1 phosphatase PAP2 family protein [Mesorhizobium sp. VK23B]MDX8475661.1 phosphatase PAP2 family protein [Mesorhizobium sp. VK23A]